MRRRFVRLLVWLLAVAVALTTFAPTAMSLSSSVTLGNTSANGAFRHTVRVAEVRTARQLLEFSQGGTDQKKCDALSVAKWTSGWVRPNSPRTSVSAGRQFDSTSISWYDAPTLLRVSDFVIATKPGTAADDPASWGGEFVDDALRSPATRPDFGNISSKIQKQMQTRGWTQSSIDEAVLGGNKFPAVNKLGGANSPATRYVHPKTGQSVVIDNTTGEIIQVGGPGFKY